MLTTGCPYFSLLHGAAFGAVFGAAASLAACAPTTPQFDAHFGEAVRLAMARQTIAPDAGANRDPATGIDGASARNAQDNYRKSFSAVPQTGAFTVGVSGGR